MDRQVIADALATQIGTVAATFGVRTETLTATASLPDNIDVALLVYPPTGTLSIGVGQVRADEYDFPVRLLRDPLSLPDRTAALYAWFNALRDLAEAKIDLGLSYVVRVSVTDARLEFDGESYSLANGLYKPCDVVELTHRVYIHEVVSTAGY